jgi:ribosomal protein L35AE/L33A
VGLGEHPGPFFLLSWLVATLAVLAVLVQSLAGAPVDALAAPPGTKAIVFLFTSTDCPVSNRYAPEVRRIAETFAGQGIVVRLVYPNPADKTAAIREHMGAFAYAGTTEGLRDPEHALVKFTGVSVTPEAAVYANGRIVYRGRIDDRFVDFGVERPVATKRDLSDALSAIVAGKAVTPATTQAVGCYIVDFKP